MLLRRPVLLTASCLPPNPPRRGARHKHLTTKGCDRKRETVGPRGARHKHRFVRGWGARDDAATSDGRGGSTAGFAADSTLPSTASPSGGSASSAAGGATPSSAKLFSSMRLRPSSLRTLSASCLTDAASASFSPASFSHSECASPRSCVSAEHSSRSSAWLRRSSASSASRAATAAVSAAVSAACWSAARSTARAATWPAKAASAGASCGSTCRTCTIRTAKFMLGPLSQATHALLVPCLPDRVHRCLHMPLWSLAFQTEYMDTQGILISNSVCYDVSVMCPCLPAALPWQQAGVHSALHTCTGRMMLALESTLTNLTSGGS